MSKHTPGPWRTENLYHTSCPENARVDVLADPKSEQHSGLKIAEASFSNIDSNYHVTNRREAEANACLIAAAPDLLAALQDLFGAELEKCMAYDGHDDQMQAVAKARAAIAKATGEGA